MEMLQNSYKWLDTMEGGARAIVRLSASKDDVTYEVLTGIIKAMIKSAGISSAYSAFLLATSELAEDEEPAMKEILQDFLAIGSSLNERLAEKIEDLNEKCFEESGE